MKSDSLDSIQRQTFADKFSKYKIRFLIVFWLVFGIAIISYFSSFISAVYSIRKINSSYFTVDFIDNHPRYVQIDTIPSNWVPIEKISKRIQQAIIASEDGKFYLHPGYDLEQLRNAINDSFILKKKLRGASTITQQLVKNLFLSRDKKMGRKANELILALMIEKYSNKQKILEIYLNIIEYGHGLYGIENATKFYFNKLPSQINAREAAFLAMLLPSPTKYAKSFKSKSLTPFANRIVRSILLKMRQSGYISESEFQEQMLGRFSWESINLNQDLEPSEEEINLEFIDSDDKE